MMLGHLFTGLSLFRQSYQVNINTRHLFVDRQEVPWGWRGERKRETPALKCH